MNKYLKEILEEMFKSVGVKFSEDLVNYPGWYMKHTWTESQEEEFKKWLIDYLNKNKEARESLMQYPSKNKKGLIKFANEFIFFCGWSVK